MVRAARVNYAVSLCAMRFSCARTFDLFFFFFFFLVYGSIIINKAQVRAVQKNVMKNSKKKNIYIYIRVTREDCS